MTLTQDVERYVGLKQRVGYKFTDARWTLLGYADFADARSERFTRTETIIEWASAARSRDRSCTKLRIARAFALWMHAEDARHEVPPPDYFGRRSRSRPPPYIMGAEDIGKILSAALLLKPAGSISPLTWHYMFGLMAVTGMRVSEAKSLLLSDIAQDGPIVRESKFGKTRLLPLHRTTWDALDRYLAVRSAVGTPDPHLFVLSHGRSPHVVTASTMFRRLACRTGVRGPDAAGPRLHDLRHSFAVGSLAGHGEEEPPQRHMLALSTYLGHGDVRDTYWYLGTTPVLLRDIARSTERAHSAGGRHD